MKKKHKWGLRIVSLLLTVVVLTSIVPVSARAAGATLTYLALGDSITTGYGLDNAATDGFVAQFAEGTGATTTVNAGVAGLTSDTLATALATGSYDTYLAQADVITITVGGNDLMAAFYDLAALIYYNATGVLLTADQVKEIITNPGKDEDTFQAAVALFTLLNTADYSSMITDSTSATAIAFQTKVNGYIANIDAIAATIKAVNPDAVILVANQYNPYQWLTGCKNISALFGAGTSIFNKTLSASTSSDYTVVDVSAAFAASSENLSNAAVDFTAASFNFDFHPNASGHQVIAEAMVSAYIFASADYIWEVPISLTVENGGTVEAPEQDFQVEIRDSSYGELIDIAEMEGTIVKDTVETDGSGATYSINLTIAGSEDTYTQLSDGFYVCLADGSADGWSYDT